jgi:hypothetical protein
MKSIIALFVCLTITTSAFAGVGSDKAVYRGGTILFLDDVAGFVGGLRKAKRVRIEARFYQEGMRTADFHTEGFEW